MASGGNRQNDEDLERLRRENRMLTQGIRQAERIHILWQQALDELKQARSQLQTQNHRLESLYRAGSALNQTTDLQQLLDHGMQVME